MKPKHKTPGKYTDDELLLMLKIYADEIEKTPTFEEFKANDKLPHPKVFIDHFGSYDKAIKKVGLLSNKIYTKEFLISEINRFIEEFGVVPAANVFRAMKGYPTTKAYRRIFGSFTECIVSIGLTPVCCQVKNAFSKRVVSIDKHICNSAEEAFVDDYLYLNNILHKREKEYPYHIKYNKNSQKRYDFLIEVVNKKVYIEYAGLINKEIYFNKMQEKIKLCAELNLNLIVIYPWNLGQLDKLIKENLELISKSDEVILVY
ncbi:MAG: homing endonuclease associated repeat-containing protein [Sarcina sp.]